jgi:hypothetical protein
MVLFGKPVSFTGKPIDFLPRKRGRQIIYKNTRKENWWQSCKIGTQGCEKMKIIHFLHFFPSFNFLNKNIFRCGRNYE